MLQNDKINCNGSFRDITMHFVTDPCVNVSILWIIIMYHVKPSCCTTPKIHWDMSNFLVHLKASWETVVWRCLEVKQEDGNGTAALLLRASRALLRAGNRWDVPTTLSPQPCPHSVCCNGTLCWEGALARQNWPLPLTAHTAPRTDLDPCETDRDRSLGPISSLKILIFKWDQQQWNNSTRSMSWKQGRS